VEIRDYLRLVKVRWPLIAVTVLLALAAAALMTMRTVPQYSSTARLFVSTQGNATDPYSGGLFSEQRVASYADLITGENLAQRVVDKLDLDESAGALSGQISSSVSPDTVILQVTVTDPSPARAQQLTQAVATEFSQLVAQLETPPGKRQPPIKVTVVDSADLPAGPISPRPLRNLALAGVLGLMLGLGLAVVKDMLDTTVKSADDVTAATKASLLGSIRYDPSAKISPLVSQLDSRAQRVEAFRMLRTSLQFIDVDKRSKVFVVSSAVPAEGKTTTAVNLALTLAQADQQVLLIEADLRRPRVSTYLRLESAVGLTTVLIGRIGVEEAIQPWGESGELHVLTSGTIPPNPSELLQSMAMEEMLAKLRTRYDVILIDAPPLLPVTDAALLAAQADGALLVVRYGKTTKDQLTLAVERLNSVDAKLLGTVINMTPNRDSSEYGHGYGYGYGYAPVDTGRRPSQRRLRLRRRSNTADHEGAAESSQQGAN